MSFSSPSHLGGPFFGILRVSSLHLSTVRHESPPHWIFKCKDVLESQDAELEVSQGSHVPKLLSTRRTMPLKSSKILSNPWKPFEILPISIVLQFVVVIQGGFVISKWIFGSKIEIPLSTIHRVSSCMPVRQKGVHTVPEPI